MLSAGGFAARGAIVYDSTTSPEIGPVQEVLPGEAYGDDVELGGPQRRLTAFTLPVYSFSDAWAGTVTATFYRNDGPDGAPGTEIWSQSLDVTEGGEGYQLLEFPALEFVELPGAFTWAYSQDLGPEQDVRLVVTEAPVATGASDPEYAWFSEDGTSWTAFNYGGDFPANFEAQITAEAVPEPAAAAVLAVGAMAALGRRRRRA